MGKEVVVIGAGFAGLTAAISLARKGYSVQLLEQHNQPGGRARLLQAAGFKFDMGPSWYWMPEVMEQFFESCGHNLYDYLTLVRLDPSYQVVLPQQQSCALPANADEIGALFEQWEPGASQQLKRFLDDAKRRYETAMGNYITRPSVSVWEFMAPELIGSVLKMGMHRSFHNYARRFFKDERILKIIEFPVLFLGATAQRIPALYSMMNYADMGLGTWYPMGGMHELVQAFVQLAQTSGVKLLLDTKVAGMESRDGKITSINTNRGVFSPDIVVSGADYHHTDQQLLEKGKSNYSTRYWQKREMAPSCLLFYVGVRKKLPRLHHHNLFFDEDFKVHASAIYRQKSWPESPLFYLCCPSKTDSSVAPAGMENLFFLVPTAPGLAAGDATIDYYWRYMLKKIEDFCGTPFESDIIYKKCYSHNDFITDYNAFMGNAYGLSNTLRQTAFMKPSIKSKRHSNLFFTGQLTVPGPGVPPAIISGQVVANYISSSLKKNYEIDI